MITKAELLKKLDNPDYGIEELILWANSLPDDHPQEPCIPVSVIRERLELARIDSSMPIERDRAKRTLADDLDRWVDVWLSRQPQPTTPQPEPGDGWEFDGEKYTRKTKPGVVYTITCKAPAFGLMLGIWLIGWSPTLDKAKALANEFAEANGGWA